MCPTCGFLSLSNQDSGRQHDAVSIVPHRPVPLSYPDHQRLQMDTIDLENDITLLDHQICRLRASLSDLHRVRNRKKSQLQRVRKSSRSSIWCLPVEIMVEIITIAADNDNSDIYHGVPWVLSHTCRLWRNIVLSTPITWSRIYIDDTMRGQDHPFAMQLLQTYLARSKETLLFVSINSSNNIDAILECLVPHHSRLYWLELNICPPGLKALSELGAANLPNLTALHFSVEGMDISGLIGGSGVLEQAVLISFYHALNRPVEAFRHAHALRDVNLYGMLYSYFKVPLKQVTRFAGDIMGLSDYLSLFRDALELAEADLRLWLSEGLSRWEIPTSGRVWHTRLTRLSLYADIPCLKFIRLPALQYLRIEETRDMKDHSFNYDVGEDIHVFLGESQCPLETLILEIPPFQLSPLTSILEVCATTLTTLSLRVDLVGARDIYGALTFDGIMCLAPNVEDLSLRDDSSSFSKTDGIDRSFHASFHGDLFFRMVQSRCSLSRGHDEGARLRSLTLCAPYSSRPTETLEKLSQWQQEGLAVEFHGYSRVVR
ncbi:hypothetical protein IW261DRAFT_1478012 [Armillaria novae-zelandiae]|uniref:F-box domain-containing protein n=1 Tax=Armillaria novae-zelandiae TaxID=153914 RepID=A0AA39UHX3_9AGAR|nr:hypothetical protein IW261DRAFT_1478012 [Armillaria novae-zelandiae]